ncbi:IS66 family insertion sequence element accessory protein TnpB [Acinetobacter thermotolerans]|uniref:IS66 family insertion sequence element accessory protein TnpB n=1 Tax=Acinetobacter thermotolerans TaxID=3151487 RepID=UPI00325AD182
MIRIDEIWLSTQPMDMRAGMDTTMAQVVRAFGYIKPHCAYLFCNKRGHRMKVLVHDGLGIWLCARRLEQGKFHWAQVHQGETVALSPGTVTGTDPRFALAAHWTTAGGDDALN